MKDLLNYMKHLSFACGIFFICILVGIGFLRSYFSDGDFFSKDNTLIAAVLIGLCSVLIMIYDLIKWGIKKLIDNYIK